jgi:hypothetical protein
MEFMDLQSSPELQLIVVMIIIPTCCNAILFWIQDAYLKGDKHYKARIAKEMEAKRLERLRLAELSRKREIAKQRDLQDFEDKSDHSIVDIQFKGRLIEQIEDGIYNIKRRGSGASDYSLESLNDAGDPRENSIAKSLDGDSNRMVKVSDEQVGRASSSEEVKRPGSAQLKHHS